MFVLRDVRVRSTHVYVAHTHTYRAHARTHTPQTRHKHTIVVSYPTRFSMRAKKTCFKDFDIDFDFDFDVDFDVGGPRSPPAEVMQPWSQSELRFEVRAVPWRRSCSLEVKANVKVKLDVLKQ